MRRKRVCLFICICAVSFCCSQQVSATIVPAMDFTAAASGGTISPSGTSSYSIGYKFQINLGITVYELGYFDDSQNGLVRQHPVGIFRNGETTPLASVTVTTTGTLVGKFRYVTLTTPLNLVSGVTYVIAGVTGTGQQMTYDKYLKNVVGISADSTITYIGPGLISAASSTSLVLPTVNNTAGNVGYFGPNFRFESLPEPATILLLGFGTLLLRRRFWLNLKKVTR